MNTKMKEIIDAIASNNARSVQKVLSTLQDWISIRINQEYDTLLHLVVYNSNEEVLKIFLNSCTTPDIKNCYDESPLHIASHLGSTSKIKMLLDYRANPNLKDINGWTPLHKAVLSGNAESLGALIERGADLDCADRNGNTALHLALEEGNKCNFPQLGITDLACIQELILKGASLEVKNIALEKPVHLACLHGDQESLKLLLENRAEFKSATRGGDTPLTYAIKKDSIKCVDLLFKAGVLIKESDARLSLEKAMIKMWQHLKKLQALQKPVNNQYETMAEVQTLDREEHDNLDYKINNLTINMRDTSFNDYSSNMELEKLKQSKLSQKYFESTKIGFPQEKTDGVTSTVPPEYASIYYENQRLQTEIEKLQHQLLGNTPEKAEGKYDVETAPVELVTHSSGTHLNKNDVQTLELLILKLRDNANKIQNTDKSKVEELCDKYHDLVDGLESWLKTTLKQQAITSQMSTQSGSSTQVEQEMIPVKDLKLQEKIGVGANAVVHRAILQGEEVAVKKIYRKGVNAKELEKIFWKEVSIMKKIRHPKIVKKPKPI